MILPTYANDGTGDPESIETGHEVECKHTGDAGRVTDVRPNGLVYVKWDTEPDDTVEHPTALIHL